MIVYTPVIPATNFHLHLRFIQLPLLLPFESSPNLISEIKALSSFSPLGLEDGVGMLILVLVSFSGNNKDRFQLVMQHSPSIVIELNIKMKNMK